MQLVPRLTLHALGTSLVGITLAMAMHMLPLIALRQFAASEWGSLFITAALPACMTASIFWDRLFRRMTLARYVTLHWLVAGLPLGLIAIAQDYWVLLLLHAAAALGAAGWAPLAGALLGRMYRGQVRGRVFSLLHCSNLLVGMGAVWGAGWWLTVDGESFRTFLPVVAGLQLAGLVVLVVLARGSAAETVPDRAARASWWRVFHDAGSVLVRDRLFLRYEIAFMTYGCGFMVCEALLPLLIERRLGLSYEDAGAWVFAVQRGLSIVFIFPAGWLMDRAGPARTCATAFVLLAAYPLLLSAATGVVGIAIASAVFGAAMAGVVQGWLIGPVTLAPDAARVSSYVAIHAALVGVRGVAGQGLGVQLYSWFDFDLPLLLAGGLFVGAAWQMWGLRGTLAARMRRGRARDARVADPAVGGSRRGPEIACAGPSACYDRSK